MSDIELNAAAADGDARMIAHHRRTSMRAAAVLDVASVGLTVVVALLVYALTAQQDAFHRQRANLLEEANAELGIFANRLSHDIVSPLASTRLAIEVALRKADDAEAVRRSLGRGLQGLDRATGIAQALLEFAQAGAHPSPAERGDVGEVVGEVLDELRPLADKTGAHLEAFVPAHASVACNKGLLTSALSNLVRNAITYLDGTPDKRVEVLAFDTGDRLRVEVRDNGRGLPPGAASRIFEPYVRGPASTQPGLGLGLATVKRIVETHGGTVGVESRAGAGARFWIELPKVA
jgi:signal transduction histidine kinase